MLGIFLASGESFKEMTKSGQDIRFKKFYLKTFAKNFSRIYIFSFANEKVNGLPQNVTVIPNKYRIHKYLYGVLLPFINFSYIIKCDGFRAYHLFGTFPAIICRIIFGKPFIFNYAYNYQEFAQIENKKFQKILLSIIEPIAILFSKRVFTATKSIFKNVGKKAVYLPNGVDTFFFRPTKNKKNRVKPIILSVGRLEKQKNYEVLINALRTVNAKLLVVGNGSLKNHLKSIAKNNGVELKIIENIENTKMPQVYNRADIFVLPSLAEGSSKVLLEAMSCGLPVIASKVKGPDEIIIDNVTGIFCSTNKRSIRNQVLKLINTQSLRKKIGTEARKRIVEHFNLSKLILTETKAIQKII